MTKFYPVVVFEDLIIGGSEVDHFLQGVLPAVHAGCDFVGDVLPVHCVLPLFRLGRPCIPATSAASLLFAGTTIESPEDKIISLSHSLILL